MARAQTRTLIPLDRAARILGIDPLHFNSIESSVSPIRNACDDFWTQFDWQQTGKASRESLAMALRMAEQSVISHYKFNPQPDWTIEEELRLTKPFRTERVNISGLNAQWRHKSVTASLGHLISPGVRGKTLIGDAAVVFSDTDSDGYDETVTLTVVTTVTETQELHVFFPDQNANPTWEVRPITVSISAGTATITFRRELIPDPDQWEIISNHNDPSYVIDGDDDANFLAEVEVWRIYNDTTSQGTFISEPYPGCSSLEETTENAKLAIRDAAKGLMIYQRADYDSDTEVWSAASFTLGREPDRIKINYYSGLRDKNLTTPLIQMDATLERLLVLYATTFMDQDICGCDYTHSMVEYWRRDLAVVKSGTFTLTPPESLDTPMGSTQIGIALHRYIKTLAERF